MLLLKDKCSYNYYYFFNLKSFKGLKFENNLIRIYNYIFFLMNIKIVL